MCVHLKLKASCAQFQNISSLPYLPDVIDLSHLSTNSGISYHVDIQDIKLTMIDNIFIVVHLNVCSLTKLTDKSKELIQPLHQKKTEVDAILLCETFFHTESLKLVQIPNCML